MLKIEEKWYKKDGLEVPNIPFFDNIGILSEYTYNNLFVSKRYKANVLFDYRFV